MIVHSAVILIGDGQRRAVLNSGNAGTFHPFGQQTEGARV